MCIHPQYIKRIDCYSLFLRGFKGLLDEETQEVRPLTQSDFYMPKQEQDVIRIAYLPNIPRKDLQLRHRVPFVYRRHDNPDVFVTRASERDLPRNWYRDYDENPERYKLVNEATGEVMPLYVKCPCNHCVVCNHSRVNKNSDRCFLQSCTSGEPYFVTLTISDDYMHLFPNREETVKVLQKFMKRLRKSLEFTNEKLKYVIVSERGTKRGRLHFHGLFWHPAPLLREYTRPAPNVVVPKFYDYLRKAWQFGNVNCHIAKDGSGKYCFKYMNKTDNINIKLQSKLLGYDKIREELAYIRRNPRKSRLYFVNRFTGESREVTINSYVVSKAYPSYARSLPKDVRDIIRKFYADANMYSTDAVLHQIQRVNYALYGLRYPYMQLDFVPRETYPNSEKIKELTYYADLLCNYFKDKDCHYITESNRLYEIHTSVLLSSFSDDETLQAQRLLEKEMKIKQLEKDEQ